MGQSVFEWRRGPRSAFTLGREAGVYALFLRNGATLAGLEPGDQGLLYIGLAANKNGLKGRCHFDARTQNHSPRKSLAVLLMKELNLLPVLIAKPNSSDTWGLDAPSDARLSAWMHANLELAIELCSDPEARETELIGRHQPPLNLAKCPQTDQHRRISNARAKVMRRLTEARRGNGSSIDGDKIPLRTSKSQVGTKPKPRAAYLVGAEMDTAEGIASRHGPNPKSYRQRLRASIAWYQKPQNWSFEVNSVEWRDMISVAERMSRLR